MWYNLYVILRTPLSGVLRRCWQASPLFCLYHLPDPDSRTAHRDLNMRHNLGIFDTLFSLLLAEIASRLCFRMQILRLKSSSSIKTRNSWLRFTMLITCLSAICINPPSVVAPDGAWHVQSGSAPALFAYSPAWSLCGLWSAGFFCLQRSFHYLLFCWFIEKRLVY